MRLLALLTIALLAPPPVEACGRSPRRTTAVCHKIQRTITGALEYSILDQRSTLERELLRREDGSIATPPGTDWIVAPDSGSILRRLTKMGYLQTLPACPYGDADNFLILRTGEVVCLLDGDFQQERSSTSARRQLERCGIRDPQLLARASPFEPGHRQPGFRQFLIVYTALLPIALLLIALRCARIPHGYATLTCLFLGMIVTFQQSQHGHEWTDDLIANAYQILFFFASPFLLGIPELMDRLAAMRRAGRQLRADLSWRHAGRCPTCSSGEGPALWVTCPACDTSHHKECWTYVKGCSIYACSERAAGTAPAGSAPPGK